MEVIRAEKMGFCFGVQEAVNLVEKVIKENPKKNKYIYGMLVHNKEVTSEFERQGVKTIDRKDIETLQADDAVIIRAHGVIKQEFEELINRGVKIYDATCIFVKKAKEMLVEYEKKGYNVVLVGDKDHPEVIGIVSFGKNTQVVANIDELKKVILKKDDKFFVLAQTTLNKNEFKIIKEFVEKEMPNSITGETICGATHERQRAVEKLAEETDIVLVVGGTSSSNTKKLYNISKTINEKTYLIETKEDIKNEWFMNRKDLKIGITAGASTPEKSIKNVETYIKEEI